MRALEYKFSLPNYLAVRAADRLPLPMLERGTIPGLREIAPGQKPLPGPEWLRIAPILSGICGSDMSTILNRSSPALMPFISFPLTPGHEIVGRVTEDRGAGSRTDAGSAGSRHAADQLPDSRASNRVVPARAASPASVRRRPKANSPPACWSASAAICPAAGRRR